MSWAPTALLLTAVLSGCASAPGGRPDAAAPPSASGGASPRAWVTLGPLTEDQLWAARLVASDLPGGTVVEPPGPAARTQSATPDAETAAGSPECGSVLAAVTEQPRARWGAVYVVGNNTLGNRTEVDLGSFDPGRVRARFDALSAAVHGGCPRLRIPAGSGYRTLTVREVPFDRLDVPAVCFALDDPSGGFASTGGLTTVVLYAALGDNRVRFATADDTGKAPALRADIVQAQLRKLAAQASPGTPSTTG
ncbi:hypothetical protein [Kitasatospora sp. NPDC088346]|uniref:hypothetical protein n=1 Tax=Kitasatospora sp. NPDC088346 TaxID=3364073 RepID=UPI003807C917